MATRHGTGIQMWVVFNTTFLAPLCKVSAAQLPIARRPWMPCQQALARCDPTIHPVMHLRCMTHPAMPLHVCFAIASMPLHVCPCQHVLARPTLPLASMPCMPCLHRERQAKRAAIWSKQVPKCMSYAMLLMLHAAHICCNSCKSPAACKTVAARQPR